jgi:tetratricopeptide (TPR) repeat protein
MTAVFYSRTSLRAVHSLKFTIDYPKVPGWFLLPVWVLSEIVQIVASVGVEGAYVSHIGGLVVGLGLGVVLLMKQQPAVVRPAVVESKNDNKIDDLLEKVDWHLAVKRYGEAREVVLKILESDLKHKTALLHLFNIDKREPDSKRFQETAALVLGYLATLKGCYDIEKYFEEYLELCPSAKVQPDLLLGVAASYIHSGKTESASKLLAIILKVAPGHVSLPACLFNLAQMYRAGNKQQKAKKCLRILATKYPETNSGRKALEFLSPRLHHTFGKEEE